MMKYGTYVSFSLVDVQDFLLLADSPVVVSNPYYTCSLTRLETKTKCFAGRWIHVRDRAKLVGNLAQLVLIYMSAIYLSATSNMVRK